MRGLLSAIYVKGRSCREAQQAIIIQGAEYTVDANHKLW